MGIVNYMQRMYLTFINKMNFSEETGASLVEYALLLALIAVVAVVALTTLGQSVSSKLSNVSSALG